MITEKMEDLKIKDKDDPIQNEEEPDIEQLQKNLPQHEDLSRVSRTNKNHHMDNIISNPDHGVLTKSRHLDNNYISLIFSIRTQVYS